MSAFLAAVFLFSASNTFLPVNAQVESTSVVEEKAYSNAKLEDEFADDRILVVLSNEASLQFLDYDATDFAEIGCAKAEDLTQDLNVSVKEKIKERGIENTKYINTFNRILCLKISNKGKENVLTAIKELQNREDVIYVGPDYVISAQSVVPDDSYVGEQWAISNIQLSSA